MIPLLAYALRPVVGLIAVALVLAAVWNAAQEFANLYAIPHAAVSAGFVATAATVFLLREQRS